MYRNTKGESCETVNTSDCYFFNILVLLRKNELFSRQMFKLLKKQDYYRFVIINESDGWVYINIGNVKELISVLYSSINITIIEYHNMVFCKIGEYIEIGYDLHLKQFYVFDGQIQKNVLQQKIELKNILSILSEFVVSSARHFDISL